MYGLAEVAAEQYRLDGKEPDQQRRNRQRHQRRLHVPADVVKMFLRVMIQSLLAMEGHEDHPEGIQRRDKNAEQHAPVGIDRAVSMRAVYGIDQGVLGIETRE